MGIPSQKALTSVVATTELRKVLSVPIPSCNGFASAFMTSVYHNRMPGGSPVGVNPGADGILQALEMMRTARTAEVV